MKTYYNGPRKGMMYGGGATMRKPMMYGGMAKKKMQMGGMADENRPKSNLPLMTDQKKYNMGMMYGGQAKLDKNKDGKISGKDFKMMK
jgi:hypothetical protein